MSKDAEGLSLLGGYGTDSEDEAPADAGGGDLDGVARAEGAPSPSGGVHVVHRVDDEADEESLPAGPARPSVAEMRAMTAAAYPSAYAADDDDDDGPAAGPSRPTAGDAVDPYAAYGAVDNRARDEDANDARENEPIAGPARPSATDLARAVGAEPAGPSTRHLPGHEPSSPKRPRIHSAPSAFVANVTVPPAPPGECTHVTSSGVSLQTKVEQWLELKRRGTEINAKLRATKGFRNPDFLRSAVTHFDVDDRGTNFAEDVFDPKGYDSEDYYDRLGAAQKKETERREKERRERGLDRKMEFRSASMLGAAAGAGRGGGARADGVQAAIARATEEALARAARLGAGRR